jgi:hypothetical protein
MRFILRCTDPWTSSSKIRTGFLKCWTAAVNWPNPGLLVSYQVPRLVLSQHFCAEACYLFLHDKTEAFPVTVRNCDNRMKYKLLEIILFHILPDTQSSQNVQTSVRNLCIFIVMFLYSYCYVCSALYILFWSCQRALFGYPFWDFSPCFFLSCKANARV